MPVFVSQAVTSCVVVILFVARVEIVLIVVDVFDSFVACHGWRVCAAVEQWEREARTAEVREFKDLEVAIPEKMYL